MPKAIPCQVKIKSPWQDIEATFESQSKLHQFCGVQKRVHASHLMPLVNEYAKRIEYLPRYKRKEKIADFKKLHIMDVEFKLLENV